MKKPAVELNNMASTFIGSVVLMATCFEPELNSPEKQCDLYWKYIKMSKKPQKYFKDTKDTWDINKILDAFGIERTWEWPVCLVTSDKNCLLCPYTTDEDKVIPLSPRIDGLPGYTLRHVESIQLIKWGSTDDCCTVNSEESAAV